MEQRFSHVSSVTDSSKFEATGGVMKECIVMKILLESQPNPKTVYLQKECISVNTVLNHLSIVVAGGVMRSTLVA
jgi:hypothetical protein